MSLAFAGTALVVSGTGNGAHTLVATLPNMGAKDGGFVYDKKNNRVKQVSFVGQRTTSTGANVALGTFVVT
jgi:hypothetical protein